MKWMKKPKNKDLVVALELLFKSQMDGQKEGGCECSSTIDFYCRECNEYYCGHKMSKKIKCPKALLLMEYFEHHFDSSKNPKVVYFDGYDSYMLPN